MTDNGICGAECVDGSACQHPAGSCPVPSHSDDSVNENPQGSRTTFNDEDARIAVGAARKGKSESGIEREVGVAERAIFGDGGWLDQGHIFTNENGNERDFFRALRRARGEGEDDWIDEGRGDGGDSSFAKFMLASSYDYKTTETHEYTGEDGGPLMILGDTDGSNE